MKRKSNLTKINKAPSYKYKRANDFYDKSIRVLDNISDVFDKVEPFILLIGIIGLVILAIKLFL